MGSLYEAQNQFEHVGYKRVAPKGQSYIALRPFGCRRRDVFKVWCRHLLPLPHRGYLFVEKNATPFLPRRGYPLLSGGCSVASTRHKTNMKMLATNGLPQWGNLILPFARSGADAGMYIKFGVDTKLAAVAPIGATCL